ncbi:NlpC/P60 family protein [Solibacillus sp. MA9]|uniref:NlpC/P60 family protein n=1 Tax=Solibacillus palustris TaxID=2908203 RepID=A0ABS9UHB6_9BACL|nr:NlpC/P60 family protein [Solibacillus sp. MA9]MCH7323731.1 NlpC/P60 family protein [Solibacillus sp. MA9]
MIKKIVLQMLVITIVLTSAVTISQAQVFIDVPDNSKLSEELMVLSDYGGITLTPNKAFRANDPITRYEMAEILMHTLQLEPEFNNIPTYSDIAANDERMPVIAAIFNARIMVGYDGKFNPDVKVTRAQAVKLLTQVYGLTGEASQAYADIPKNHNAYNAVQAFIANQIIIPAKNEKFKPNAMMTRGQFASYLARIIEPSIRITEPEQPVYESCAIDTGKKRYVVDVAVTNLWHQSNQAREVDYPSTKNPVEMQKWISSLSLAQKKWLVGKTDTQALYGDEVSLLETKGKWQRIAAKDQYVPYLKAGYPGWVPVTHVVATTKNYDDCSKAIITAKKTMLLDEDTKKKFLEISYATILPVIEEDNTYYYVETPSDGIKLLKKSDAKSYQKYSDIAKPTADTIIKEAKRFLDLPYLWAGTSSWGYDCSGILYGVFRTHGIMIPRDSFYQATGGKAVAKKDLKPGDLVFFAYNGGKGEVYHVGLYVGDGKMLHAPHYASKVKIESMNQGAYKKNYSGARRYL